MSEFIQRLVEADKLQVKQVMEGLELIGLETRNKYKIDAGSAENIAFAAEQSTGFGGTILRQILGHWRSFSVTIFDEQRSPIFKLDFPFRWFFKTLFVTDTHGRKVGHLQQRFAIFRKKFDVFDANGMLVAKINSSFFRFWTFEFEDKGRVIGKIQKQWAGILSEAFTDKDNFVISFKNPNLTTDMKVLMLSTCLLVDIIYFENNKASVFDLADLGS